MEEFKALWAENTDAKSGNNDQNIQKRGLA